MQRKSFADMACPIARGLDEVGEWWSMLILRDSLRGITRFDDLRASLGIAPAMLTRRLVALVEAGLLERRRYCERPPRDEYVPTAKGRAFRPVLLALFAWGSRHAGSSDGRLVLVDAATGEPVDPVLVDRTTGRPLDEDVRLRVERRADPPPGGDPPRGAEPAAGALTSDGAAGGERT